MWIKFIKDVPESRKGGVVWCAESYGQEAVNNEIAVRCLNPDGDIFEDVAPEVIITQLAKEDGVTFDEEEKHLEKVIKKFSKKGDREKVSRGQFIPDSLIDKSDFKK